LMTRGASSVAAVSLIAGTLFMHGLLQF